MGADIAGELVGITDSTLDHEWHVALDTRNTKPDVLFNILVFIFFIMAIFALGTCRLNTLLTELDYTSVRVMACYTFNGYVLTLEKLLVLFVVLYKTARSVDLLHISTPVAIPAFLCIALNLHGNTTRVGYVQAARSVTFFTLDTRLGPRSNQSRHRYAAVQGFRKIK